jgi:EmrB/QacA subfamily drug resistance transporter
MTGRDGRVGSRHHRLPHRDVLVMLCVAEFVLTLDLSIVNVALPAVGDDLGLDTASLQWVVNGYVLTFAGFLLLGGRAADVFGGRRVFRAALAVFAVASLACALAPTPTVLVASRVAQGLGAGALAPTTLSILTRIYGDPVVRNRALSVWTAVGIGGGAAGGLVGGLLTAALSWRAVFLVNVPLGVILLAYAVRLPPTRPEVTPQSLDVSGAVTGTGGLTALVWALVHVQTAGWGSQRVVWALILASLLLAAFAAIEARWAESPLVPFEVFTSRLVSAGNVLSFLGFAPVMATWFLLTLHLQVVRGYTPLETGMLFLPLSLAVVVGAQIGFRLLARADTRVLFAAGGLLGVLGLEWLSSVTAGTATPTAWVAAAAVLTMAGGGVMFAPITVAATAGMPPGREGMASGLLNTSRQIGGAVGLAVVVSQAGAGPADAATGADPGLGYSIGAAIFLVTALVGALVLPAQLEGTPAARVDDGTAADRPPREAGRR